MLTKTSLYVIFLYNKISHFKISPEAITFYQLYFWFKLNLLSRLSQSKARKDLTKVRFSWQCAFLDVMSCYLIVIQIKRFICFLKIFLIIKFTLFTISSHKLLSTKMSTCISIVMRSIRVKRVSLWSRQKGWVNSNWK